MVPSRSNAAPDFTTTPNRLAAPIAETTVTGTEIARAHGEAATRTINARVIHSSGSPSSEPRPATSRASTSTPGISGRAIRSARRARSPFSVWARSTRPTIVVSVLSVPGAVVVRSRRPEVLIEPARTRSPGATSTGIDSPVTAEASTLLRPRATIPSVATRSPGATTSVSSTRSSAVGISVVRAPRRTVAVSGTSVRRERRPERARSIALSSSASAIE